MCLTIEKGAGQEKTVVNKLSMLLERSMTILLYSSLLFLLFCLEGMTNVLALPHARVPIVKFKDPKSRFLCDVSKDSIYFLFFLSNFIKNHHDTLRYA